MKRRADFEARLLAELHPQSRHRDDSRRRGLVLPSLLMIIAAVALTFAWRWIRPSHEAEIQVLCESIARALAQAEAPPQPAAFWEPIRAELETLGFVPANSSLLGFGGIRAKVRAPRDLPNPVWTLVGNLYLASGDTIYTVEFSAKRAEHTYVLTDLWSAERTGLTPADLPAHNTERIEAFVGSPADDDPETRLVSPTTVLILL